MAEIKDMSPPEAWEFLQTHPDAILLDVRSTMEYHYVGHPVDAVHVPLLEPPDWELVPDFVARVRVALPPLPDAARPVESRPVLAICRSGQRSATAAGLLLQDGFERVWNIREGFEGDRNAERQRGAINGWRYHRLPWEQS